MQILTQLAGIAQLAQRCSRTALSLICAIVQRHVTSETWMPFLQEACPSCPDDACTASCMPEIKQPDQPFILCVEQLRATPVSPPQDQWHPHAPDLRGTQPLLYGLA